MTRTNRSRRSGYTLLELMVVLALLILLGMAIVPTLTGHYGNTRQQAAADIVRGRLANARAKAIEHGIPYRLAIHKDGNRVRVGPDGPNFASADASGDGGLGARTTEDAFDTATIQLMTGSDAGEQPADGDWVTVVVVMPDGTFRENDVLLSVNEGNNKPIVIRVRALTGTSRIVPKANGGAP